MSTAFCIPKKFESRLINMNVKTIDTVTKKDLVEIGYHENTAVEIIRLAKHSMVEQGYEFYSNKRLGRVPAWAVNAIIGASPLTKENA